MKDLVAAKDPRNVVAPVTFSNSSQEQRNISVRNHSPNELVMVSGCSISQV